MARKIVLFFIISICFVLQTTTFQTLSFANITPNLMIIIVSSFGLMRGRKEGMFIGFICGLLIDIFCGFYIGIYALLYMYVGYINGFFRKRFYPEDIKQPLYSSRIERLFVSHIKYDTVGNPCIRQENAEDLPSITVPQTFLPTQHPLCPQNVLFYNECLDSIS